MKYKTQGHCPYCDTELGIITGWGMSVQGFQEYLKKHEANHPENTGEVTAMLDKPGGVQKEESQGIIGDAINRGIKNKIQPMQKKNNLGNLPKTIDCWVEDLIKRNKFNKNDTPTVWFEKPDDRELKSMKEYGYKCYKAKIVLMEEVTADKPLILKYKARK
jgi:hypothetical protein